MQLSIGIRIIFLVTALLPAMAKPTFDKMADILLNALDDRPHYTRPRPYGPPPPLAGPAIEEGYDHGYDWYYGGGGNGQVVANPWPAQPPQPYGYYSRPPVQRPVNGYYPPPQYQQGYPAPAAPTYGHQHGYSYGGQYAEGHGGYKKHGY